MICVILEGREVCLIKINFSLWQVCYLVAVQTRVHCAIRHSPPIPKWTLNFIPRHMKWSITKPVSLLTSVWISFPLDLEVPNHGIC